MRFKVVNIGCKVNRVEVDAAAAELLSQGAVMADAADPADVVLVNTCTVTAEADKKTRKAVRQALKANPQARLLVTGCAAVMNPEWFEELDARVLVVPKPDIVEKAWEVSEPVETTSGAPGGRYSMLKQSCFGEIPTGDFASCGTARGIPSAGCPGTVASHEAKLGQSAGETGRGSTRSSAATENVQWAPERPKAATKCPWGSFSQSEDCLSMEPRPVPPMALSGAEYPGAIRAGRGFRTRVGIKAQDGCNNACTFCIVHVARGTSRSVPFERVVEDARAHAQAGVRELVLTGINLGAYHDGGRGLAQLLEALLAACPESRFRIGSIEPADVDEALIRLMAASDGRICRHLHLPLQSGSGRVLAEMNRPYDAAAFLDLVSRLRQAMPQLSLSTDIIVGFPGETEADFQATLDVAAQAAFSKIHVFRYSRREGTPAAERADQVPAEISAERSRLLQERGRELALADARRRLGTFERVLVESAGRGTTESYHPVRWRTASPQPGELPLVLLTDLSEDGIFLA